MNKTRVTLMLLGAAALAVVVTGFRANTPTGPTAGPSSPSSAGSSVAKRWYDSAQVQRGEPLYQQHCAACHQPDASGTPNWREPGPDGNYPPPPLNGAAHTWRHPLAALRRTVQRGGVPLGGVMPGFADKLNPREIDAILAWVQSRWDDRTYAVWQ